MNKIDSEKILITTVAVFMLGFGAGTATNIFDFFGGFFTGSTAIIAYAYWKN